MSLPRNHAKKTAVCPGVIGSVDSNGSLSDSWWMRIDGSAVVRPDKGRPRVSFLFRQAHGTRNSRKLKAESLVWLDEKEWVVAKIVKGIFPDGKDDANPSSVLRKTKGDANR